MMPAADVENEALCYMAKKMKEKYILLSYFNFMQRNT